MRCVYKREKQARKGMKPKSVACLLRSEHSIRCFHLYQLIQSSEPPPVMHKVVPLSDEEIRTQRFYIICPGADWNPGQPGSKVQALPFTLLTPGTGLSDSEVHSHHCLTELLPRGDKSVWVQGVAGLQPVFLSHPSVTSVKSIIIFLVYEVKALFWRTWINLRSYLFVYCYSHFIFMNCHLRN